MKHLILLISVFAMVGCSNPTIPTKKLASTYGGDGITVSIELEEMEYEGCQYVGRFNGGNTNWGSHKGNCTNPIHNQNHVTIVDTVEYQLIRK